MLLMVGLYTILEKEGMPAIHSTVAVGLVVFAAIGLLAAQRLWQKK
jgi:MFS transporter, LPLT family, lysophospholipid transporter